MSYSIEPMIFEHFKGIREYNGVNAAGEISAITSNNVELVQTEIGSSTGIKSMNGNEVVYSLPEGYSTLGLFKTLQENDTEYLLIYGENNEKGTLFFINLSNEVEVLIDGLTKTGNCNGLTMSSSAFDVFVFTNGVEVRTVCFTSDSAYSAVIANYSPVKFDLGFIATITPQDYLKRDIKWLSMTEWNGFLVVASDYGVHASHQNDIYVWNDNPIGAADSWYIDFSKKITAVFGFTGGLYIFSQEDCTLLNTTPNDTANAIIKTSAGIGCYSYQSIVKHDLYLFFYDNNQKNIYYLSATDTTGQIRPNGPVAKEIQSYFNNIKSFKMFSCIYNNKNEIWCLINDSILIFDYAQQEWMCRQEQNIFTLCLLDNQIYTGSELGEIYAEYIGRDFSGQFFPSIYKTTFINAGSSTNIKKQKTPLLLTLNANSKNDFWVQLTVNYKEKTPKRVKISDPQDGIYAPEEENAVITPNMCYDTAKYVEENNYSKKVVEISTPQTWYTLGIKIYTEDLDQGFFITSMELKNMKMKNKTKGR